MGYTWIAIFSMSDLPSFPGSRQLADVQAGLIPRLFDDAGERCRNQFVEFFVATIRNPNTRMSYARAVWRFAVWCEQKKIPLERVAPPSYVFLTFSESHSSVCNSFRGWQ